MDDSVVIAMLPDAEAAQAFAGQLDRIELGRAPIAVIRSACLPEDREATVAIVLEPGHSPVLVAGFLVRALFGAIAEGQEASLLLGALRRLAVPRSSALAYTEAVRHGGALLALLTPHTEIERTCRTLEAEGAPAPSVHHLPTTRSLEA
jgi:hypothetical protein